MTNKFYPFDKRLEHRALGSAAITAETVLATITERAAQRTMYLTKVNVEAVKKTANNEAYTVVVEVSNDDFATREVAAILSLGAAEVRQSTAPDTKVGDEYDIHWTTEVNGIKYEKSRIKMFTAGTTPSITVGCWSTIATG
ncbi:hypothetical protein [Ruegeria sp. EL01]|jgi:hypothetical protein|uniref:hypothetical protein n=1 Tax=Ruegeria sp. EL01 TaxID=2107578 RepID=UPI000EA7F44B|nr:hypothetical protein [Ruegeria sp. EL01]